MLYKRAPALVLHWDGDAGWIENYARRSRLRASTDTVAVLMSLSRWSTDAELTLACGDRERVDVQRIITELVQAGMVVTVPPGESDAEVAFREWDNWSPSAAFFHQATKDVAYISSQEAHERLGARIVFDPPPVFDATVPALRLPDPEHVSGITDVLKARRTCRAFGADPLTHRQLSTLLGLTWGYTGYLDGGPGACRPLRTSPSGGACQSIEVYVAARRVEGLVPGLYRYRSASHGLDHLAPPPVEEELAHWIGGQAWVAGAAAVCFMTSVFERVQWKYRFARAYRVVLLEAGHLGQTFCLLATAMNLASFSSAALADTAIETALGIDGIRESVLYAVGAGTHPEAKALHDKDETA